MYAYCLKEFFNKLRLCESWNINNHNSKYNNTLGDHNPKYQYDPEYHHNTKYYHIPAYQHDLKYRYNPAYHFNVKHFPNSKYHASPKCHHSHNLQYNHISRYYVNSK